VALILTVDDEGLIRQILSRCIAALGHEPLEAESADAALDVMATRPVAVAFCDIQMPGKDGLWLAAELRKRYPTTAIVLATGVSAIPPNVSMRAGILAYLVKPFSPEQVGNALDAALKWHRDTVAAGPHPDDTGDRVQEWLDSLE
jgi:DNA-binding NtrC family response regulator